MTPLPDTAIASPGRLPPVLIIVAAFAVLLGGAMTLWAFYGTAVFFEMIAAGLAYCF